MLQGLESPRIPARAQSSELAVSDKGAWTPKPCGLQNYQILPNQAVMALSDSYLTALASWLAVQWWQARCLVSLKSWPGAGQAGPLLRPCPGPKLLADDMSNITAWMPARQDVLSAGWRCAKPFWLAGIAAASSCSWRIWWHCRRHGHLNTASQCLA